MTDNEARIFLSMAEGDDPQEAMEEALFQFKKFFTSQTIIHTTFHSKLKKLNKMEEAARFFGMHFSEIKLPLVPELKTSRLMLEVFQDYQMIKNQLFLAVHTCDNPSRLEEVVHELLNLQSKYSALWPEIKTIENSIVLAKETDPMEMLVNLKNWKEQGVETFSDLSIVNSIIKSCAEIESQRLYLLSQKELQWKKKSLEI